MKAKIITLFLTICFWASYGQVQASLITIQIAGEITDVTAQHVPSSLTDDIHVGDIFAGTYTYNSSILDSDADPQRGEYRHSTPYGISVSIESFDFNTTSSHTDQFVVTVEDNYIFNNMYDRYILTSFSNATLVDFPSYSIQWKLSDNTHSALSSTALPEAAPDLDNWDSNRFIIYGSEYIPEGDYWRVFNLEGIVTQSVLIPEPATGILLLTSGVLFLRRKRQSRLFSKCGDAACRVK